MRLGFVTFEPMGVEEAIAAAGDYGFDFIELQMAYLAAGTPQLGREYVHEHASAIQTRLDTHDLSAVVHLPHRLDIGAIPPGIREACVDETKACLRAAALINAEKCVIHPTATARERVWNAGVIRDRVLQSIRDLDEFARKQGITLCMENLYRGVFTIHDFDRFFTETECQMTLDTGHARVAGMREPDIAEFVSTYRDRIGHVHVNDNKAFVVGMNEPPSDDHVPTGAGDLDFRTALNPLLDGWTGTASLELHTAALEYVEVAKRQFDRMIA